MFRKYILPFIVYTFYSALRLTWRVRIIESPEMKAAIETGRPFILAHWHGDELGILHLLRRYRPAVMTSTSKDGELMDAVVKKFGAQTSRGSSTRGGVSALKGMLRLAKDGWRPSIAVDGPKGPYHKVKPGIFEISKLTGLEIFPLTVECDRAHVFHKAWNKTFLPLPFANVVCVAGQPLPPVSRGDDAHNPELAAQLEKSLDDAKRHARNSIASL